MRARNGAYGYGWVTRTLHWTTVVALVAQFFVGWTMSDDGSDARADALEERWENRVEPAPGGGEQQEEAREAELDRRLDALEGRDDDALTLQLLGDGLTSVEVHVLLGLLVIVLGTARLVWRRFTPLPPWADHLSDAERRLETGLEKLMLTLVLVVPGTGLLLVLGEDDWLPVHVTAQVALLAAVAVHVGLVLRHTVVRRDGHLARML